MKTTVVGEVLVYNHKKHSNASCGQLASDHLPPVNYSSYHEQKSEPCLLQMYMHIPTHACTHIFYIWYVTKFWWENFGNLNWHKNSADNILANALSYHTLSNKLAKIGWQNFPKISPTKILHHTVVTLAASTVSLWRCTRSWSERLKLFVVFWLWDISSVSMLSFSTSDVAAARRFLFPLVALFDCSCCFLRCCCWAIPNTRIMLSVIMSIECMCISTGALCQTRQ